MIGKSLQNKQVQIPDHVLLVISEVQNVQSLGALPPYNWIFNFSPSLAQQLAVPRRHRRPRGTKKRPPWHTMKSETGGVDLNVDSALTMWSNYPPTITGRIALSKCFSPYIIASAKRNNFRPRRLADSVGHVVSAEWQGSCVFTLPTWALETQEPLLR